MLCLFILLRCVWQSNVFNFHKAHLSVFLLRAMLLVSHLKLFANARPHRFSPVYSCSSSAGFIYPLGLWCILSSFHRRCEVEVEAHLLACKCPTVPAPCWKNRPSFLRWITFSLLPVIGSSMQRGFISERSAPVHRSTRPSFHEHRTFLLIVVSQYVLTSGTKSSNCSLASGLFCSL